MNIPAAAKGMMRLIAAVAALTVAGCASSLSPEASSEFSSSAYRPYQKLLDLQPPASKIAVAVYRYDDKTGQFKPSQTSQTLSRAVTQGAATILVQALQNAGRGSWFTIVERENLKNLLTERKIIAQMRKQYMSAQGVKLPPIGPMLYAGIILEGGIVGYDSNTVTGGAGARYLGIGGNVEYRQDTVTVYLRAISTKNGAILKSVMTTKNIFSYGIRADVFKFIDFAKLLEVETGYTNNEPGMFALKKAIEKAVYLMVMEGAGDKMWSFRDAEEGRKALLAYRKEEYDESDPSPPPANKQLAAKSAPKPATPEPAPAQSAAATRDAATAAKPVATVAKPNARSVFAAVAAPPPATPEMKRVARTEPSAKSPYAVHLATASSPQEIKASWTELRRLHPDLFRHLPAGIDRGPSGSSKGSGYRLVAGQFANVLAASHFCGQVKQRNLSCGILRAPLTALAPVPATVQTASAPGSAKSAPVKVRAVATPANQSGRQAAVHRVAAGAEAPFKNGAAQEAQEKSESRIASAVAAIKNPKNRASGQPQRLWTSVTKPPARGQDGLSGPYLVQLSATRSKQGVHAAWARLARSHPDLFDSVKPAVIKKDLGQGKGTWYRLFVGPFDDMRGAADFCSKVKDRKLSCGVKKR